MSPVKLKRGFGMSPRFALIRFSEKGKFALRVRSEKTKWEWTLRLNSIRINLVPPAGGRCGEILKSWEESNRCYFCHCCTWIDRGHEHLWWFQTKGTMSIHWHVASRGKLLDTIYATICVTQLVWFILKRRGGIQKNPSHLTLIIGCLRGSGMSPHSALTRFLE